MISFGLTCAPSTFCYFMNETLKSIKNFNRVYLDDIVVSGQSVVSIWGILQQSYNR